MGNGNGNGDLVQLIMESNSIRCTVWSEEVT
jgi:hypothetical protein